MDSNQTVSIICHYVKELNSLKGYLKDLNRITNKLEQRYDFFAIRYNYVHVKHNNTANFLFRNNKLIIETLQSIEKKYIINNCRIKSIQAEILHIENKLNKYIKI
jgi:hypothetical protein